MKSAPSIFAKTQNFMLKKKNKFGAKIALFGYFGLEFEKPIIVIISLFNVDAKNRVKNYNKKEIIVYIINYNI